MREISRLFAQTHVLMSRLVERLRSNGFNHPSYPLKRPGLSLLLLLIFTS